MKFNSLFRIFFCRTTKDQLGVPKANSDILCVADAKPEENQLLRILQMKYRKNKLALLVRILQMESNPKLLLQSLDLADFAYLLDDSVGTSEIDYADYSDEVKALIDACGRTTKFEQRLKEKEQIMLDAIDNHVLEAMPTSDEDLEIIFSKL